LFGEGYASKKIVDFILNNDLNIHKKMTYWHEKIINSHYCKSRV
jgi:hypothetical protein